MKNDAEKKATQILLINDIFDFLIERIDDITEFTADCIDSTEWTDIKIKIKPKPYEQRVIDVSDWVRRDDDIADDLIELDAIKYLKENEE